MRLWHKDLIRVLPRQQLLGQWRECHLIAKEISKKGTPNHILVNPIIEYPLNHFYNYCQLVVRVMINRGYTASTEKIYEYLKDKDMDFYTLDKGIIFDKWHTDRYLYQCMSNLEEKYDRGGITKEEWGVVLDYIKHRLGPASDSE